MVSHEFCTTLTTIAAASELQAELVIDDVAHWIENLDAPLPSGVDDVSVAP